MGACCSCLGLGQRGGHGEDDRAPLLNDNYHAQYGSQAGHANRLHYQPDPEHMRREREALDSICHTMSDNVIDVFTIQPPHPHGARTPRAAPEPAPTVNGRGGDGGDGDFIQQTYGHLTSEEVKLRTIKKGRGNAVFSSLGRAGQGWKAVQDAIG